MKCPFCKSEKVKIVDTKKFETVVFRVRVCENCHSPFKTVEQIEIISQVNFIIDPTKINPT